MDNLTQLKNKPKFYHDISFWSLVIANMLTIIWALIARWQLGLIMLVYWLQSVSIGIFWFFKIIMLKKFSTEGFLVNDMPVKPTKGTKVETAIFFLVHYGFWHYIFLSFVLSESKVKVSFQFVVIAFIFFVYQGFSFFYNKKWETRGRPNIGGLMFFPYVRIIPMHVTILAFGFLDSFFAVFASKTALVLFMLTKTAADVIMHAIEVYGFSVPKEKGE